MAKNKSRKKSSTSPSPTPNLPVEQFASLRRIRIDGLFGYLNHDLELDDSGITILHGANGTGKSTILRVLNIVSREEFSRLLTIPFASIHLEFLDNLKLEIYKDGTQHEPKLRVVITLSGRIIRTGFVYEPMDGRESHIRREVLHRWELEEAYLGLLRQRRLVEPQMRFFDPRWQGAREDPEFIKLIQSKFRAVFIQEQRLLKIVEDKEGRRLVFRRVVEDYSAELRSKIRDVLSEYAAHSQQLDRSFPQRVIAALEADISPMTDVSSQLQTLDEKRQQLHAAGLIDQEPAATFDSQKLKNDHVARVLSVYVEDTRSKLAIFENVFRKIQLFEELINSHLVRKTVHISKDKGLELTPSLDPSSLSSGEQHLLVLFYELIFGDIKPAQLVLIDEPELSLHPGWQLRFVADLERIREINQLSFILATHSPQIVGNRWSATRALELPSE